MSSDINNLLQTYVNKFQRWCQSMSFPDSQKVSQFCNEARHVMARARPFKNSFLLLLLLLLSEIYSNWNWHLIHRQRISTQLRPIVSINLFLSRCSFLFLFFLYFCHMLLGWAIYYIRLCDACSSWSKLLIFRNTCDTKWYLVEQTHIISFRVYLLCFVLTKDVTLILYVSIAEAQSAV